MSKIIVTFLLLMHSTWLLAQESIRFENFFIDKTMRIDYFQMGDAKEEIITIDHIYQQDKWAGSLKNLIDYFNDGKYYIKVYDVATNTLIFSRGFDCYFGEYETTMPASNGIKRTYHGSALIPYPKKPILFMIEKRDKLNILHALFTQKIDPQDLHIIKERKKSDDVIYEALKNGDPHEKVDLGWLAEGYAASDKEKFKKDVDRFVDIFFSIEPFKKNKSRFNINGVFRASLESGVDQPREGIFKNTVINSSFNALDLDRYLLTEDNKSLRDIAAQVPYDAVIIMVNCARYGGGGIYNSYAVSTVDNELSKNVFIHEFGHAFVGLADEYYASDVAYNDFYPQGVEPTAANITALLDPDNIKWKALLSPGIQIPTDWGKAKYDELQRERGKIGRAKTETAASLRQKGASEDEIKKAEAEYDQQLREFSSKIDAFYEEQRHLKEKVGAFEGAGYTSKGFYRPEMNCMMFSNQELRFCKVCQQAIQRMIDFHSH